jgi:hypothetical protein
MAAVSSRSLNPTGRSSGWIYITALPLAFLFDALLRETTEVAGVTYGPIVLEAYHLGCGLNTGLKAPAQSLDRIWT